VAAAAVPDIDERTKKARTKITAGPIDLRRVLRPFGAEFIYFTFTRTEPTTPCITTYGILRPDREWGSKRESTFAKSRKEEVSSEGGEAQVRRASPLLSERADR
jgi:hypothetical protein